MKCSDGNVYEAKEAEGFHPFRTILSLKFIGREIIIKPAFSLFRKRYLLLERDMEIEEIKKDFPILRKRTLVLTRKLSEPIVFFIVWIVIMLGLQSDLDNLSLVNVNGG